MTGAAASEPSFCELSSFVLTGYRRMRSASYVLRMSTDRVEVSHIGIEPYVVFIRRDNDWHTVVHIRYERIRSLSGSCNSR